jgi:3-phenylpropionate/trans-cinnamate dioxygenase ferredoxin subunit
MHMSEWIYVADTYTIPADQLTTFQVQGEEILVYHTGNNYYVYPNRCTHEAVPLSGGYLVKGAIICRMHGAKFDLQTGACLRTPAYTNLQAYPVTVRDQKLYIKLQETPPTGLDLPPPAMTIRSRQEACPPKALRV